MTLEPGQTYVPSSAAELREDLLADFQLAAEDAGITDPPIEPGTDWYILASGMAQMGMLAFANIRVAEDNTDVFSATDDELDAIREAEGLPVVPPAPSSGSIIVRLATGTSQLIPAGLQGTLPNGKRFKTTQSVVVTETTGIGGGPATPDVPIITIDTGADTQFAAGATVKFLSPPGALLVEANVSAADPLSGGTDEETDPRKRDRILNRRRNIPAGENWGAFIEAALNASSALQTAFVYPALGGPSSRKLVLAKDISPSVRDFDRAPSSVLVTTIRQAIFATFSSENETVVQAVGEEDVDVAIAVTIPDAFSAGGTGEGWRDDTPWPPLTGAETRILVTASTTNTVSVDADDATGPTAGQNHIKWWSTNDQRFYVRLVTAVSGSAGSWTLTLDQPLADSNGNTPAVGDYISPAAVNSEAYGETFRDLMRRLGPGENTTDANRLPRAKRRPFTTASWPSDLTLVVLKDFLTKHGETSDAAWSYRSLTTPTVPTSVATAPNVLKLRHFGIYPQ